MARSRRVLDRVIVGDRPEPRNVWDLPNPKQSFQWKTGGGGPVHWTMRDDDREGRYVDWRSLSSKRPVGDPTGIVRKDAAERLKEAIREQSRLLRHGPAIGTPYDPGLMSPDPFARPSPAAPRETYRRVEPQVGPVAETVGGQFSAAPGSWVRQQQLADIWAAQEAYRRAAEQRQQEIEEMMPWPMGLQGAWDRYRFGG